MIGAYNGDQSARALAIADGCVEEANYRLKLDSSYTGGTIAYASTSCTISVSGSGTTRTVTSTATISGFTRRVVSSITLTANTAANAHGIDLTQWNDQ